MNWELFIGRFHPLMVHLPIGIFIIGYFFEVLSLFGFQRLILSRKIIIVTYTAGLATGLGAAFTGWLLSFSNDYGISPLNNHKLLGIATLVVMLAVIIYQIKAPTGKEKLKLAGSSLAIVLMAITGHFGGNLTHGSSYLVEYGPNFLNDSENVLFEKVSNKHPDSIKIYVDIIDPIIQNKCLACHSTEHKQGGLILAGYNDLFTDVDHDKPIQPGNPASSPLFNRVSLPDDHEKVMPPRGPGLSYTEIQILRYWITHGADSLTTFNSGNMSEELISLMQRDYQLDFSPKPYYEKIKVDSIDEALLTQVRQAGFRANYLAENNMLLDVEFKGDSIDRDQIVALNKVADQITFLKISNCQLSDELALDIAAIKHLTRMDLSKNALTGEMITFIAKHPNLEVVNLYETKINNESLQNLLNQSGLSKIYVSNTDVSTEELANLRQAFPNVEIISSFSFDEIVEAQSVFRQEAAQ